ncbi:MAG: tectonin domain-containing protein [bacterium]
MKSWNFLSKILFICFATLLFNTTKAVTYDEVKKTLDYAESKVNEILRHTKPTTEVKFTPIKELNMDFVNLYNITKQALNNTGNLINSYNIETNNNANVTFKVNEAKNLLNSAGAKKDGGDHNHGRDWLVNALNKLKEAFNLLQEQTISGEGEVGPLKNYSLVTIKVNNKYLSADIISDTPQIKLVDKLQAPYQGNNNQIFIIRKSGEYVAFQSMKDFINDGNFLEFNINNEAKLLNQGFDSGKFFRLNAVSGKTNTYYIFSYPRQTYVMQTGETIKTGYAQSDIGNKVSAQFEIKEFTLDDPAAKTILNPTFYRPDLVTIRNVGQNKYLSGSYNEAGYGGNINQSRALQLVDKPIPLTSVFKIAKSDQDLTKQDPNYRDWFDKPGYETWFSFIATYRLGFSGGQRGLMDIADEGYFNLTVATNAYRNFELSRVPNTEKEYYIIKNQFHNKYLRVSGGKLLADQNDAGSAMADQHCWFEIAEFKMEPNLYILNKETENFKFPSAGNGFITFQVKTPNRLELTFLDNNNNTIGKIVFSKNEISGEFQTTSFRVRQDNIFDSDSTKFSPFWITISNQTLITGKGDTAGQNTLNLETEGNVKQASLKIPALTNIVAVKFAGDPNTFLFKPSVTQPTVTIDIPPKPGEGETIVKLESGYYKIKNVETNTYMTIKDSNLDADIYNTNGKPWVIYSLRFENPINNATQIFKIEETDGWHKIIGSLDATYQLPNSGIIDTGLGTAYFNKQFDFSTYRKIKITQKAGVLGSFITSEKDANSKYGVEANKLMKDKANPRFIFEKVMVPDATTIEPIAELKVEKYDLDINEVPGGLTQVSVGGNLICGINSSNRLYKWDNAKNTWTLFSDANYKHVSVGDDNIVLTLGTDNKIYTRKDDKWLLFGKGILPTTPTITTQTETANSTPSGELPVPGSLPAPTTLPTPPSTPTLPVIGPDGIAYFATAQAIQMKQIEIGSKDYIWGLGQDNKAYMWNGSEWIDKSIGMKFNYISVGIDGTVMALDSTNKLASWTGSNWTISPFKVHQVSVTNKDKHWAITKEEDGSFNVYKFVDNGYVLRAKNLQQVSANLEGTLFGISTLKISGGFKIYARIIKLYGKILDKLNNAKEKTTVKEKIEEINKAIDLAVAEKVAAELTSDELSALKLETYTELYNILSKQLEAAKTENVLKELKNLVTKAGASVLIADNIKPLLISYAETKIILEEPKPETPATATTATAADRRRITTTTYTPRGRAVGPSQQTTTRGGTVIPVQQTAVPAATTGGSTTQDIIAKKTL